MTKRSFRILILGCNYAILPATKLSLAGHRVTLVGRSEEVDRIVSTGTRLEVPCREDNSTLIIDRAATHGPPEQADILGFQIPDEVAPVEYDLVMLAMQEPQYQNESVAKLMTGIADQNTPCLSLMNLPPLPFLSRFDGVDSAALTDVFASENVWQLFNPQVVTAASPDPQAIRPESDTPGFIRVTLPTNFKVAPFAEQVHQAIVNRIAQDVDAIRIETPDGARTPRVRFVAHDSLFAPFAKWPMIITGNSRCLGRTGGPNSICDAVWTDEAASRELYESINTLVRKLGASDSDLVPFEKYAAAAKSLTRPSSVARALHAGATVVERVDLLIYRLAQANSVATPALTRVIEDIERRLASNVVVC